MEFSTLLQIIPILGLVMYMFYMTYFYAFPMFILKILLFYGHIRYRGSFITLSRHMPMDVCNEFRDLLREIRKGSAVTAEQEAPREQP